MAWQQHCHDLVWQVSHNGVLSVITVSSAGSRYGVAWVNVYLSLFVWRASDSGFPPFASPIQLH